MKLRLNTGGKVILAILFIIVVYLFIRLLGFLFSTDNQDNNKIESEINTIVKIPDRSFRVGYVKGNLPENILFAATIEQHENFTGSIFKKNGLNVELIECQNYVDLASLLNSGGDKGGFDAVYCNTNQFVQKSSLFSESNSKVFLLADKKTEKNYLITHKTIKTVKELNNKLILVNDLNSSTYILTQLLNQNKTYSANIVFSTDDKTSYEKLLSGDVAAIVIKEQSILDEIKKDNNYKILYELNNSISNVLISSSSALDEYNPYIKTFAKCCLIANDSLKTKKQLYPNISFVDIGANYSYFSLEPKKTSSAFESEISNIFNSLQKFIVAEKQIVPRDLIYMQIFSDIYSTTNDNNNNITLPTTKDTLVATKEKTDNTYTAKTEPNQTKATKYEYQNNVNPKKKQPSKKEKAYRAKSNKSKINPKRTSPPKNDYKDMEIENDYFIINFAFNSTKINPTASRKLALAVEEIKKNDSSTIELIGHTDFYGKKAYNLKLSKKRSLAVRDYLNKNFEIDTSMSVIIGKGSSSPIRDNRNSKVRKYNRRVNIVIKDNE
jgi:outer membrane protein OmpA-like peptidoglycan-associated protein